MAKKIIILSFIFCFEGTASPCQRELSRPIQGQTVETPSPHSVRSSVWSIFRGKKSVKHIHQYGTGFFIAPNKLVTSFHVIKNVSKITELILFQKGEGLKLEIPARATIPEQFTQFLTQLLTENGTQILTVKKVLQVSALHNLALLETHQRVRNYLSIRKDPLQENEDLFITGYNNETIIDGKKRGKAFFSGESVSFPLDSRQTPFGLSGSPVIDANKEVVGVSYGAMSDFISAVSLEHIKKFVDRTLQSTSIRTGGFKQIVRREMDRLKRLANTGDAQAQYVLGRLYLPRPNGMKINGFTSYEKSFEYYKKAADQGYAISQYIVGSMYSKGDGVTQDGDAAFQYYKMAAKQGYAPAQFNLAAWILRLNSAFQNQNNDEARYWLKKAAAQGYAPARTMLFSLSARLRGF